jgi:hypothetical protein
VLISSADDLQLELAIALSKRLLDESQRPETSLSTLAAMALEIAEKLVEFPRDPTSQHRPHVWDLRVIRGGRNRKDTTR